MNVLLIDDERMEREGIIFLSRRLKEPLTFYQAKNGQEGLEQMAQTAMDIVIVDIKMPVMGGLAFLEQATKQYPTAQYIIYSAYSEFEYAREAINLSVLDYIVKPMEEDEFYTVMDKVLGAARAEKRRAQREAIRRAIRGLSLEGTETLAQGIDGVSFLLYFEHPVLDTKSDQLQSLTKAMFEDSEVFIENEHECFIVLLKTPVDLEARLEKLLQQLNDVMRSSCQAMVSARFTDYAQLKDTLQHARKRMNEGFFTKQNAIMFADETQSGGHVDYFQQIDENELQRNDTAERVACILDALQDAEAYSNIYTKYTLVKRIEQVVHHVEPRLIEQMLAARSLSELREAARHVILQSPRKMEGTEAAKEYIHHHYGEDISIDDIADNVLLSSNYLCTVFKKETGMTLISYLTGYRMQMARQLVSETGMKYSDIAKKVGYRNTSYFNMIFKNHFGCTPSAYRAGER